MRLEVGDDVRSVKLSATDHPAPIAWLIYAPPGVLPESPKIPGTPVIRIRTRMRRQKLNVVGKHHGAKAIRIPYPDPVAFARFLGKVAYCFAVACHGIEATRDAPLLGAVLSEGNEIFRFVGNVENGTSFTGDIEQEVAMGSGEHGRVAYVRLIGGIGAPEYVVHIDAPAG